MLQLNQKLHTLIITEKQLHKMVQILTLLCEPYVSPSVDGRKQIIELVNEITAQQSEKLIEVKDAD